MAQNRSKLEAGLYFIATPIGNARDITLRALDILTWGDVLVAEDTRALRRLMEIHQIPRNGREILTYHDQNGARQQPVILRHLADQRAVVYAAEAGTAMISDPGYSLNKLALENGYEIFHAPGASAGIMALCASGLGTDRFLFAGFPPPRKSARLRFLENLKPGQATIILYEAPHRIHALLHDIATVFGVNHEIAFCRELTKKFETVLRGGVEDIIEQIGSDKVRGECVVVVARIGKEIPDQSTLETELGEMLLINSLPKSAKLIAERFGLPKAEIYALALKLKKHALET